MNDCQVCLRLFTGGIRSCSPNAFQCADGSCIALELHCDGKADCMDGYDERSCQAGLCILWFILFTYLCSVVAHVVLLLGAIVE